MPQKNIILICGAGLGGSTCAIILAELGYQVILVDKAVFPRKKLCGEFLGPDAMPILNKLDLLQTIFSASNGPVENIHLYNVKGDRLHIRTNWIRQDYPYALAIPRELLDSLLLQKAKSLGVQVIEGRQILSVRQVSDDIFITTLAPSNTHLEETISANCIVDALGRNSRLSALNRRPDSTCTSSEKHLIQTERHVGVQCHLRISSTNNDLSMFFFKGGYGGLQPITSETANLCLWLTPQLAQTIPKGLSSLLEASLHQNPVAKDLLSTMEPIESLATVAGLSSLHAWDYSKKLISIGDAQLAVEPFSGFGMSHALKTGLLAAECIHQGFENNCTYSQILTKYQADYQRNFRWHLAVLRFGRAFLHTHKLHSILWPSVRPFLPTLTNLYR